MDGSFFQGCARTISIHTSNPLRRNIDFPVKNNSFIHLISIMIVSDV